MVTHNNTNSGMCYAIPISFKNFPGRVTKVIFKTPSGSRYSETYDTQRSKIRAVEARPAPHPPFRIYYDDRRRRDRTGPDRVRHFHWMGGAHAQSSRGVHVLVQRLRARGSGDAPWVAMTATHRPLRGLVVVEPGGTRTPRHVRRPSSGMHGPDLSDGAAGDDLLHYTRVEEIIASGAMGQVRTVYGTSTGWAAHMLSHLVDNTPGSTTTSPRSGRWVRPQVVASCLMATHRPIT